MRIPLLDTNQRGCTVVDLVLMEQVHLLSTNLRRISLGFSLLSISSITVLPSMGIFPDRLIPVT